MFLHLLHVSIVFPIVSNCCLFHFIQWAFQWCDKVALAPGAPALLPLSLLETNFISNFRSLRSASVNWIQHFTIQYCFFAICFILRSCFAIVSNCYPLDENRSLRLTSVNYPTFGKNILSYQRYTTIYRPVVKLRNWRKCGAKTCSCRSLLVYECD